MNENRARLYLQAAYGTDKEVMKRLLEEENLIEVSKERREAEKHVSPWVLLRRAYEEKKDEK